MFDNPERLFGGTRPLLELIEKIYASASDPSLWPEVLENITQATGSEQTLFFAPVENTELPGALCCKRTGPDVLPLYLQHYHSINVLAEPCDRLFAPGTIRYSHIAVPDEKFEKTEFYNDFFVPSDVHYSFGLKVLLGESSVAYLSSQRAKRDGAFGRPESAVLETLKPHLKRSLEMQLTLRHMESRYWGWSAH